MLLKVMEIYEAIEGDLSERSAYSLVIFPEHSEARGTKWREVSVGETLINTPPKSFLNLILDLLHS